VHNEFESQTKIFYRRKHLVLLVTVFFIPAFAGAFTPGDCKPDRGFGMKRHHASPLRIWRNPKMIQELGLTDEQVKGLREADFAHREKRLQLKYKLDGLRLEMKKLLEVRKLLTGDQLKKLKRFDFHHHARHGKMYGNEKHHRTPPKFVGTN